MAFSVFLENSVRKIPCLWLIAASVLYHADNFLVAAVVTVSGSVAAINAIAFSGNPAAFNVTPGNSPRLDTSTSYSLTTNQSSQKITAKLNSALPAGVTLSVLLAAPTGSTTAGTVVLSTTDASVVTAISQLVQAGLGVTYSVSVTPTAAVVTGTTATVTYTLSS
jgi:hypothetical protein